MTTQDLINELKKIRESYMEQFNADLAEIRKQELAKGIMSLDLTINKLTKEA